VRSAPVIGLQPGVVPSPVDLHSPRPGRVFEWKRDGNPRDIIPLVIFPADPVNPLCPPYPGLRPEELDDISHPRSCFTDGGLGAWDPRYYPQLFDPTRPWLGYHRAPRPDAWWYAFTPPPPTTHRAFYPDHSRGFIAHYLPVTEYFEWNQPSRPEHGGKWRKELFRSLFIYRSDYEESILIRLKDLRQFEPDFSLAAYRLPWYDELDFEDAMSWETWQEGRDALGRICRYVAEMEAMSEWLQTLCALKRSNPHRENPPGSMFWSYMGTWVTTIQTKEEWTLLHQGFVPVYILSKVPLGHPIAFEAKAGELDGGERYRDNRFDRQHEMPNFVLLKPKYSFTWPSYLQEPAVDPQLLPSEILDPFPFPFEPQYFPRLLSVVWNDPSPRTAANLPWTAYLFNHPLAEKQEPIVVMQDVENRWQLDYKAECLRLFSFAPPVRGFLSLEHDRHPFFWVYDEIREHSDTHYVEKHNKELDFWYFQLARGHSIERVSQLAYAFVYPEANITIHSNFPFPGRSRLLGQITSTAQHSTPDQATRMYFKKRLDSSAREAFSNGDLEPEYVWTSTAPIEETSAGPNSIANPSEEAQEMDWDLQPDTVDSFTDPAVPSNMLGLELDFDASQHDAVETASFECARELLKAQRVELQCQRDRRLFDPIKGTDLISDSVVPWKPWSALEIIVWPLRIACLHGDTSMTAFLLMLSQRYSIDLEDVLLVSSYAELDQSLTVDLGLRYAEDALWLWVVLQGAIVDGRLLDVYPLNALKGAGQTLDLSGIVPSISHENNRAARIEDIIQLQDLWPTDARLSLSDLQEAISILRSQNDEGQMHLSNPFPHPCKIYSYET
jgi:hypothetical protein